MSQFKILFGMKLCETILKITDNLSKALQKESLSATNAQHLAEMTVKALKSIRTDDSFKLFFQQLEILRSRTDTGEPSLPRKRKVPRHLEIGDGEGYHSSTVHEHHCQQYFEAMDLAIQAFKTALISLDMLSIETLKHCCLKQQTKRTILLNCKK